MKNWRHGAACCLLATVLVAIAAGCGSGGGPDTTGKNATTYPIEVTIGGLDEGYVVLSNGLDTTQVDADADGLAADRTVTLDTELPAGVGYDVRIVNDPMAQFALQCDVVGGQGTMPAHVLNTVLVRCARVKSVRKLAGVLPADVASRDGLAADARFKYPAGLVEDKARNIYVADSGNSTIRRITPVGIVSTFAGSAGLAGAGDGKGADARFNELQGLAIDDAGKLYVADTGNGAVRVVTPEGEVRTLVGGTLDHPFGVAVDAVGIDAGGKVYVTDTGAHAIRRIGKRDDGTIVVDTLAPGAEFNFPKGIAVDGTGNVYVADTAGIRRINAADGSVEMLADEGLSLPCCIALDNDGNLHIADTGNNVIRILTKSGELVLLAGGSTRPGGPDDGVGADARFHDPQGIAADGRGNTLVADTTAQTIRRISPAGVTETLAGRSSSAGYKDGVVASALFSGPTGISVDAEGAVYVADTNNNTVRVVSKDGVVRTLVGSATDPPGLGGDTLASVRLNLPRGIAADGRGGVYVADTDNSRVLHVTASNELEILRGVPFDRPRGLAVDGEGNLYVADTGNHAIRMMRPDGTLAWTRVDAALHEVDGLALDASGNLFATNSNELFSTVVRVSRDGVVTTIAGAPGETDPFVDDVADSVNARFNGPQGLAVDAAGNVYVADSNHRAIRVLNALPDGKYQVRTVTGGPSSILTRTGPLPQPIGMPAGLAITPRRLYFATGDTVLFIDR